MSGDSRLFEIFLDIQRGLPRQGPGSNESTLKALSFCDKLPEKPSVLDIGCGPGMQTIALAKNLNCKVSALDLLQEYLDELKERAARQGILECIDVKLGDMNTLPYEPGSFDLIWAEGSAYCMGFGNALESWKPFLKPGGYTALSELVWLDSDPPSEVYEFFGEEYPLMTDIANNIDMINSAGYELKAHFTLPDSDWWDHYYTPLEAKLPALYEKYKGDEEAVSVVDMTAREIQMRRRFHEWYGYEFFVCRAVK